MWTGSNVKCDCSNSKWMKVNITTVIREEREMDETLWDVDFLLTFAILSFNMAVKHQNHAFSSLVTCSTKT